MLETAEASQLDEVRRHRVGLRRTMTAIEEATAAALAGRASEWRENLLPRIDDLRDAWSAHISATEGAGGLWEQIRADAPRLDGNLQRLGREHVTLAGDIELLHQGLAEAGDEARLIVLREDVVAVLTRLTRHRQRGADLIYEAYKHDVGGTG